MDSVAAGALRLAAARGDIQTLKLLSKFPAYQVDAATKGFTPLMAAVVQGQEAATIWLLQQGASLTSFKDDGGPPGWEALCTARRLPAGGAAAGARSECSTCLEPRAPLAVLRPGAAAPACLPAGWHDTVLHYAAAKGNMKVVQALLAFGADAKAVNALNKTPADVAAINKHTLVSEYLSTVASGRVAPPAKAGYMAMQIGWRASGGGKAGAPGMLDDASRSPRASLGDHGLRKVVVTENGAQGEVLPGAEEVRRCARQAAALVPPRCHSVCTGLTRCCGRWLTRALPARPPAAPTRHRPGLPPRLRGLGLARHHPAAHRPPVPLLRVPVPHRRGCLHRLEGAEDAGQRQRAHRHPALLDRRVWLPAAGLCVRHGPVVDDRAPPQVRTVPELPSLHANSPPQAAQNMAQRCRPDCGFRRRC
jgi:hypothetical protein